MTREQRQVLSFMDAMHQRWRPAPTAPHLVPVDEQRLRVQMLIEECDELCDALDSYSLPAIAKELCDVLYVVYGTALTYGLDLEPLFQAVHVNNMTKATGAVRADGKRLKPADYQPVDLAPVLACLRERRITL